jgi:hypothetical protein
MVAAEPFLELGAGGVRHPLFAHVHLDVPAIGHDPDRHERLVQGARLVQHLHRVRTAVEATPPPVHAEVVPVVRGVIASVRTCRTDDQTLVPVGKEGVELDSEPLRKGLRKRERDGGVPGPGVPEKPTPLPLHDVPVPADEIEPAREVAHRVVAEVLGEEHPITGHEVVVRPHALARDSRLRIAVGVDTGPLVSFLPVRDGHAVLVGDHLAAFVDEDHLLPGGFGLLRARRILECAADRVPDEPFRLALGLIHRRIPQPVEHLGVGRCRQQQSETGHEDEGTDEDRETHRASRVSSADLLHSYQRRNRRTPANPFRLWPALLAPDRRFHRFRLRNVQGLHCLAALDPQSCGGSLTDLQNCERIPDQWDRLGEAPLEGEGGTNAAMRGGGGEMSFRERALQDGGGLPAQLLRTVSVPAP